MNTQLSTKSKGFTIIEVVLVLAIAGLIFLMVFIALPALQANQRDTSRRNSASSFASQIASYQSSTRGNIPTAQATVTACPATPNSTVACFVSRYMSTGDIWLDPETSSQYTQLASTTSEQALTAAQPGSWVYTTSTLCSDTTPGATTAGTARQFALRMRLESGLHCVDNR